MLFYYKRYITYNMQIRLLQDFLREERVEK